MERCSVAIIKFHKTFSEETPLMVRFLWMSNIWGRNEPTARISKILNKSAKILWRTLS
jgi:hypothetical protein